MRESLLVQQLVPLARADRDGFNVFARLHQWHTSAFAVSLG
jgi:hypothetical protein